MVIKYLAQFLLIPLIKQLVDWLGDEYKKSRDAKRLKEEANQQGAKYEQASAEEAHDEFRKLP